MQRTIHRVEVNNGRRGTAHGYAFTGWEYEEGWLITFWMVGRDPVKNVWAEGLTTFYSVPWIRPGEQRVIEINPEPIVLTAEEKDAISTMVWRWKIAEPLTMAGTSMVESLAKALDLPNNDALDMFRRAGRDPGIQDDVVKTLEENGYKARVSGPEGFAKFRDHRRLVTMFRKDDPESVHVVLIYENDERLFDPDGLFNEVRDLLFPSALGYEKGPALIIGKK
jgi:hypothetical protein